MDKIREALRARIRELDITDSEASRRIGQHRGYVHEFMTGKQESLPYDVKLKIAEELKMPLSALGLSNLSGGALVVTDLGFSDDAEAYIPPPGSILAHTEAIGYYRILSNVLENHPLRISHGDVLAFDMSQRAVEGVQTEKIVIVQCYDPDPQVRKAHTIVREYIRPGLLITNRAKNNEIISLDDPSLPFEPVIKGVFRGLARE